MPLKMATTASSGIARFLASEAAGGIVLMLAAALAMILANSPLSADYFHLLHAETGPVLSNKLGPMTVHLWINDGVMAIFFLLVGLEIKREFVDGRLMTWQQRRLPFVAAAGGMVVPALVYLGIAGGIPGLASGWAIPAATDIAFAIGVMALLGKRVPTTLKLFLTTVAIVDDMGAVAIIAVAYTASLSWAALAIAGVIFAAMMGLNRMGVRSLVVYLAGFAALWLAVLASGVHATIAGVLAAMAVPTVATPGTPDSPDSPLHKLEHMLHPLSAWFVVPLFGLANAGIALEGMGPGTLAAPLPLGIAAGLFIGKQAGIFGAVWLAVRSGFAAMPRGATWTQVYGVAVLCGIGFTMSLFIAMLAFPGAEMLVEEAKLGVLAGSLLSGVVGYVILRTARQADNCDEAERVVAEEIDGDGDVRTL